MRVLTDLNASIICRANHIGKDCASTEGHTISGIADVDFIQASEIDDNVLSLDVEGRCPSMSASLSQKIKIVLITIFDLGHISQRLRRLRQNLLTVFCTSSSSATLTTYSGCGA